MKVKLISTLALAAGAAVVLTASKCEHVTQFDPYVQEICHDNIDNNGDGLTDCADPQCAGTSECKVSVTLAAIPATISADTLVLTGSQTNANSIAVNVAPSGEGGTAVITGSTWTFTLRLLTNRTTYALNIVATDAQGGTAVDTASFTRQ